MDITGKDLWSKCAFKCGRKSNTENDDWTSNGDSCRQWMQRTTANSCWAAGTCRNCDVDEQGDDGQADQQHEPIDHSAEEIRWPAQSQIFATNEALPRAHRDVVSTWRSWKTIRVTALNTAGWRRLRRYSSTKTKLPQSSVSVVWMSETTGDWKQMSVNWQRAAKQRDTVLCCLTRQPSLTDNGQLLPTSTAHHLRVVGIELKPIWWHTQWCDVRQTTEWQWQWQWTDKAADIVSNNQSDKVSGVNDRQAWNNGQAECDHATYTIYGWKLDNFRRSKFGPIH